MSALTAEQVIELLTNYTRETGESVKILLVGALALQAYGYQDRLTRDLDAEVVGSIEPLSDFLRQHSIPADLDSIKGHADTVLHLRDARQNYR